MEAFLIGEIRLTGTRVAFSQTCSTGVHPPGKDRENLNQRGPESWGWSGMIAEMFNPGKACSIGLSRRAPWRTGEPVWLAMETLRRLRRWRSTFRGYRATGTS